MSADCTQPHRGATLLPPVGYAECKTGGRSRDANPLNGLLQPCQAGPDVRSQMHAQRPTPATQQHLKVATGLGRLHHPKCESLVRYPEVEGVIARDLQEHAAVRTALVRLAVECRKRGPNSRQVATRFASRMLSLMDCSSRQACAGCGETARSRRASKGSRSESMCTRSVRTRHAPEGSPQSPSPRPDYGCRTPRRA